MVPSVAAYNINIVLCNTKVNQKMPKNKKKIAPAAEGGLRGLNGSRA
jgi:hypothetical protein